MIDTAPFFYFNLCSGILTSVHGKSPISLTKKKFGIVVASWNADVTGALYHGAHEAPISLGAKKDHIIRKDVPGSF